MFKRFIRAIKSMFGGLVSSMEDPKLILEQNIRELNDQIPEMNENIATVKANAVMQVPDFVRRAAGRVLAGGVICAAAELHGQGEKAAFDFNRV